MPAAPSPRRPRDLACGGSGLLLWCLPGAALVFSAPMGDARWWVWTPALTIMAVACLVNAARCRRLHCYLTGPVFLAGALLSALRGLEAVGPSWNWISGALLIGLAAGCGAECVFGSYVRSRRDAAR
jgi:hypothetical protein